MWRLSWIALAILISDQATKYFISDYLMRHGDVRLTPFLNLVLVHNTGAAFGFLSTAGGWQNVFFIAVAAIAVVVILWVVHRLPSHERLMAIGLWLILGGAVGNVIDRVFYGHVIDFIDVYAGSWHWPAFNVADSAITIGAVLLVLDTIKVRR